MLEANQASPDNFTLAAPAASAIYLPAVNVSYAEVGQQTVDPQRRFPSGLCSADLAFWTGTSTLWNHCFGLHSMGQYRPQAIIRSGLFFRQQGRYVLMGDSGGYQIGKGTLEGFAGLKAAMDPARACNAWRDNEHNVEALIESLELFFDLAATIDMPLWSQREKDSAFSRCTEQQLLTLTDWNLKMIQRLRRGRTRWLNVIQGLDEPSIERWWQRVSWFRYGGWSLAGAAGWRGGLALLLSTVLKMRDHKAFDPGQDWVHVLGTSTPMWHVLLTGLQAQMREINPGLQISYDSASPFSMAGNRDQYYEPPNLGPQKENWSLRAHTLGADKHHADPTDCTPSGLQSPLGARLLMNHLVVNGKDFAKTRLDEVSRQLLANHNIWILLDAARRADQDVVRKQVPDLYRSGLDVIAEAFRQENWRGFIAANQQLLDQIAGNTFDTGEKP
jgi:hypothetical protein